MSKGFDVDDVDPRLMGLIDKMVSARAMWIVSVGWVERRCELFTVMYHIKLSNLLVRSQTRLLLME